MVRISLLALPLLSAVAEREAMPTARLIETTTKLLDKANTEAISPNILKFCNATLHKIDDDVIPNIFKEHNISVEELSAAHAKFDEALAEVNQQHGEVDGFDIEVNTITQTHKQCREELSTIITEEYSCNVTKQTKEKTIETWEELLTHKDTEITKHWCVEEHDPLSDEFFDTNKKLLVEYTERQQKIETEWEEIEKTDCGTTTRETTEKKETCDVTQSTLEETSCKRANRLVELEEGFNSTWQVLIINYNDLVNTTQQEVTHRKEEFVGLHIVMCLLREVVKVAEIDGPCNETHHEKIKTQVQKCHTEKEDTTDLDIHVDPVPDRPSFEHAPIPCDAEYLALHYSSLPASAAAAECKNTHCSAKVQAIVEAHNR